MRKTTLLAFALFSALAINAQTTTAKKTTRKVAVVKKSPDKQSVSKSTITKKAEPKQPVITKKAELKKPITKKPIALNTTASIIPQNLTDNKTSETTASLTAVTLIKEKQAIIETQRETIIPYSPKVIDVTEQTLKLGAGKKEELMFGFAAGDKIIFNFEEADHKDVKEIEIIEYPALPRFSDYKTASIKNKEIIVNKQGVFIFRLKNSSLAKRICKLKIQRIPASQVSENFNSSVSWITKQDTIWNSYTTNVIIGYDTSYVPKTKKVLVRSEIEEQVISDNIKRVSPQQQNESRTSIVLALPVNNRTPYRTTRVISWAYWIGVGSEANRAWQQNLRSVRTNNMDYYTPLGAYANGGIAYLMLPKTGQPVNYFIADQDNRDLFIQKQPFRYLDNGKGFGGYKKFILANQCQGSFYLCLENADLSGFADVSIKVIALVEKSFFEDQSYEEQVVTPITETQIKQQPVIKNTTLPLTGM
jgi:hypothetical protein